MIEKHFYSDFEPIYTESLEVRNPDKTVFDLISEPPSQALCNKIDAVTVSSSSLYQGPTDRPFGT